MVQMPTGWGRVAELNRYRELVFCLVSRDLRVRYKRSVLGVLWAFAEPLLLMALFTIVFSLFLHVPVANYPAFVLCGIVVWGFFQSGVTYPLSSVTMNSSLVKKIYFPREILPLSMVIGRFVHFLLSLLLLVPFLAWFRVPLSTNLLLLPLLILLQLMLTLGLALLFSALSTLYEDVAFLVGFSFTGLFYVSPVLYPVEMVPEAFRALYMLNPVAALLCGYRAALLGTGAFPWQALGLAAVLSLLALGLGYAVFKRLEWSFAEVL